MTTRIHWNKDEKFEIARRAFEIKSSAAYADTDLEAVRQAMREVVEPARWRTLTQMQQVDFVIPLWKEFKAEAKHHAPQAILPVTAPHVERHVQEQHRAGVTLDQFSNLEIMTEFMKRMMHTMDPEYQRRLMREEINAVLDRRLPGMLPPDPALSAPVEPVTEEPTAAHKPKILILGLDGSQRHKLETQYKGLVKFFFLDGSEGIKRIRSTMDTMDFTFKTKWCKGNLDGLRAQNLTYVNGTDSIHRLITDKFNIRIEK